MCTEQNTKKHTMKARVPYKAHQCRSCEQQRDSVSQYQSCKTCKHNYYAHYHARPILVNLNCWYIATMRLAKAETNVTHVISSFWAPLYYFCQPILGGIIVTRPFGSHSKSANKIDALDARMLNTFRVQVCHTILYLYTAYLTLYYSI